MEYTAAQLQEAIARANAANRPDAVADLEARLAAVQANAYARDDGTAFMEGYNPATELNAMQAGLVGVGRTFDKGWAGIKDLVAGDERQAEIAAEQQANDAAYQGLQDEYPVASTVGEVVPYLATLPVTGGMATQAVVGGGIGATMYNTPEERVKQGTIDAGLSAAPYGAGRLLKRAVAANSSRLANRANDLNWKLTPGEALDSSGLRNLEASMESFPPTAGPMRRRKAGRQESMNRIALEAIGETGNDFADDALMAARARVGEVFDTVIKPKSYEIDNAFLNQLGEVEGVAKQGLLGGGDTGKIVDRVLEIASKGEGVVTGSELQQWRTTLATAASKAAKSDTATQEYTNALKNAGRAIDDLIERNLTPDELVDWKKAREQWTAIKQLEKSKAIDEVGNVRGRKLANNLSSNDLPGYYRGQNKSDLYDAARLSRAYPPMADSGTAARMSIPAMMGMTLTSPLSVPAFGAMNLGARAYANPEAYGKAAAGVARGLTQSDGSPEDRQRQLAEQIRRGR